MAEASTDKSTVNLVVLLLGIASILGLGGLIYLVQDGTPAESLIVISTPVAGIVGALGAMLSSTRSVDLEGMKKLSESQAAQQLEQVLAPPVSTDFNRTGDWNPTGDPEFAPVPDEGAGQPGQL